MEYEERLQQALEAVKAYGSAKAAAKALGIPERTMQSRVLEAKKRNKDAGFVVQEIPDCTDTAEELIARRKKQFAKKDAHEKALHLIKVKIKTSGAIGIMHFGDPHLDDDGTDIGLIEKHVELVNKTDGLFGGSVGDYSNNWVGRLARLYADQSTSKKEAHVLIEWFIRSVDWLYLIGGNHDVWSGDDDPIKWFSRAHGAMYQHHIARLGLQFPNGKEVRINARHDFKGHSQYNPAHGPQKAAMLGWKDHILVCGDKHTCGYSISVDPSSGLLSHSIRVGTYKIHDRYAKECGFPNGNVSPAFVTVINPEAKTETDLVTVFLNPETGADFLKYLRRKQKT